MMVKSEIFSYNERISIDDMREVTAMSLGDIIYAVVDMAEKGFTPVLADKSDTFPIRHGRSHTVFFQKVEQENAQAPVETDQSGPIENPAGDKVVLGTDEQAPDWKIFEAIKKKPKLKEFAKVFGIELKDGTIKAMKAQFEKEHAMRN